MKESGVPPTDPEYLKATQFLRSIQQQHIMMKNQQQFMQQQKAQKQMQQQQQQQQQQAIQQQQRQQQGGPEEVTNNVQSASGTPAPANGNHSASAASTPTASASGSSGNLFTQQQLGLLRQQISAFKLLGKNAGVSLQLQQAIFQQRQRRQAPPVDPAQQTPGAKPAGSQPQADSSKSVAAGEQAALDEASSTPKPHTYKSVKSPYGSSMIQSDIKYFDHAQRKNRWFIPGVFPTGIDFDHLRYEREVVVFNRMSQRYSELKTLPANLAHWDSTKETVEADDSLKRKAIIEMKGLGLYAKQRALREKIGRLMMHYDNLAMTTNRTNYRRMKKQNVREARITEKLEKQQRDARETREKKKHTDFLRAIYTHRAEIHENANAQKQKSHKLSRLMYQQHFHIEKEEQKRIERTAKQRLQALKANDEEAYLKLLDQAKDTRITQLLKQTDGFLNQLASSVKAQQRQAAERYGEGAELPEEESDIEELEDDEEGGGKKIDYYAVAHRVREEVTEQANMLVGGHSKGVPGQGFAVDDFSIQQQPQWYSCRRNGSW